MPLSDAAADEGAEGSYRQIMTALHGKLVTLRSATAEDSAMLATVRATPQVRQRWGGGDDLIGELLDDLATPELHVLVIEFEGRIVGAIQWEAEDDPMYRHAGIDLYIDPAVHGRGLGSDAVRTVYFQPRWLGKQRATAAARGSDALRTLARYLFEDHGHHRLVIDPAADNFAAIACYRKVGFRAVGVMRQYERSADGNWHDGLLMELLAGELTD